MAIFTFSTKATRPTDTEAMESIKHHCDRQGLNYSALVVNILKAWEADHVERPTKVQSSK